MAAGSSAAIAAFRLSCALWNLRERIRRYGRIRKSLLIVLFVGEKATQTSAHFRGATYVFDRLKR
jgi:hypothetical protein